MNLFDVNVWVAGISERHIHHGAVRRWRDAADRPLALCRITQMGILRLVTNRAVLGPDVLTRREAWATLSTLRSSADVVWMDEPDGLEDAWRLFSAHDDRDHKLWTDDYLAAFALAGGMRLVTLDRALVRRYPSVEVVVAT
jgi:toxin-antitoxin system PIN domain toxin